MPRSRPVRLRTLQLLTAGMQPCHRRMHRLQAPRWIQTPPQTLIPTLRHHMTSLPSHSRLTTTLLLLLLPSHSLLRRPCSGTLPR